MDSLQKHLKKDSFPITFEPDSPKGAQLTNYLTLDIPSKIAAFCLYNNPRGEPRLDPFVYGQKLRDIYKKDIIANIRIQDYSIPLFQSILWGGHNLGIKNLLMVTGDYHHHSPFLLDVTEALTGITTYLNQGYFMPELKKKAQRYHNRYFNTKTVFSPKKCEGKTSFFVGSALVVTRRKEKEIYHKKIQAGSQFFMTQLTYTPTDIINFMETTNPTKPILVGSGPITSLNTIRFFKEQLHIPGLSHHLINRLKQSKDMGKESVRICTEMYHTLRDFARENNYTLGAHVMSIRKPQLALEIIKEI